MNKVILLGNLTRDVELKSIPGGATVGGFGIAHNRKYRTQSGEEREDVLFVDCEVWDKKAENMAKYCRKGSRMLVEGRLKLDQWEKDGEKRTKLKVVVESFEFAGGKKDDDPADTGARKPLPRKPVTSPGETLNEEDIPF